MIGALIGAGANLVSGAMDAVTTAYQNKLDREYNSKEAEKARAFNAEQAVLSRDFNSAEAQKARDFNSAEVQKARDYSTEMSNTAYQRAVADMQAAGINPALAYSQGGASSGSAVSASGGAASGGAASGGAASYKSTSLQTGKAVAAAAGVVADYFQHKADALTAKQTMQEMFKNKKLLEEFKSDLWYTNASSLEFLRRRRR